MSGDAKYICLLAIRSSGGSKYICLLAIQTSGETKYICFLIAPILDAINIYFYRKKRILAVTPTMLPWQIMAG